MVTVLRELRSVYRAVAYECGQRDCDFSLQRRAQTVF
jgi:hypothetical protein